MNEASQDDGKAMLGILVQELSANLGGVFPGLDCAVVFWTRGEHDSRLSNVVYAAPGAFQEALEAMETAIRATREASSGLTLHGLDTPFRVCFYEQDFYVLSNFSAFSVQWRGMRFDTVEHAYHFEKFAHEEDGDLFPTLKDIRTGILVAASAHDAFHIAHNYKTRRRADWDEVKVDIMRNLLRAKANQHEYVRRKLLQTGERELVENSWRDDVWGWGPNRDGQNMLGRLWMEIRAELRAEDAAP